jgi:N-acetylmuramoyl-L-alanine amidase
MLFRNNRLIWLLLAAALLLARGPVCVRAEERRSTVILDAGHGGEDGGAVSADGTPESGINLQIAGRIRDVLIFLGYETVMTREGEGAVYSEGAVTLREKKVSDLNNRVALINGTENARLISIHQNSLPSHPRVHGAKVFYNAVHPAAGMAQSVQSALNAAVNAGNERPVTAIDSTIFLMKESRRPAILVECGFMSNPDEAAMLRDPVYQTRLAAAIAAGYAAFDTDPNRSGDTDEE